VGQVEPVDLRGGKGEKLAGTGGIGYCNLSGRVKNNNRRKIIERSIFCLRTRYLSEKVSLFAPTWVGVG
jgi:hypothetical protein